MKVSNKIMVRAVSKASCSRPAVTPDTLLEFNDVNHSFLQYYCIHGNKLNWYGRLQNLGLTTSTPLILHCPPEITEILGIDNLDTVSISLAEISPARSITLKCLHPLSKAKKEHAPFQRGLEVKEGNTFTFKGHVVKVVESIPSPGFLTDQTLLQDDLPEEKNETDSSNQNTEKSNKTEGTDEKS